MRPVRQQQSPERRSAAPARLAVIAVSLLSPSAFAQERDAGAEAKSAGYPAHANGDGSTHRAFSPQRWAEDWRPDMGSEKPGSFLDRVKYIRIGPSPDRYLTLSGNLRLRTDLISHPDLKRGPGRYQLLRRIHVGADLHWGEHVRVYGELAHADVIGDRARESPGTFHNALAVQQAFAEVSGRTGSLDVGLRAGRQEFTDGPAHLLSARDNNGVRLTMNGARGWLRGTRVRADLFDLRPTLYGRGGLGDDRSDPDRRFSGVTLGVKIDDGADVFLEPFLWRDRNLNAAWGAERSESERYFGGVRVWGQSRRLTFDWSLNRQWGHFGDRQIDAWQFSGSQALDISAMKTLRLSMAFDYASGGSRDRGRQRTADAPFGNGTYLSYGLFLTPSNLVAAGGGVSGMPTEGMRLSLDFRRTWKAKANDAVYRSGGKAYAGTDSVSARHIADIARAEMQWTIMANVALTLRFENFSPGRALADAGHAGAKVATGWLAFRF